MRPSIMIRITSLLLLLLSTSFAFAQQAGEEDLESAFDLKLKAEKVGDYEDVVKLCISAIEKGLDEEGENEAKSLASSALYQQAEQLKLRLRSQRDPTFFRNKAVKLLNEAVEFNPDMGEAWLLIAQLNLLKGGDQDEARTAIDRAISLMSEQPKKQSEAYLLRSMLVQKEDRKRSREDLDKAIELNDTSIGALRTRCTILLLEGEVDEGLKDHERIIELNEGKVEILLSQGMALLRLADAKQVAAMSLENDDQDSDDESKENDEPKQSLEELKADETKIRETVLDVFTEAVELAPEKDAYYGLKADAQLALDQKEDALTTIDTLLERNDKSIAALQKKARILLLDKENDEETIKVLERAIKLDPYDMDTRLIRMQFFTAREQYSSATEEAEKILEKDPRNIGVMDRLALLYSLDDKPKKAIEIYSGLLARIPLSALEQVPPRSRPIILAQRIGTLRSRGDAYLSTSEHEKAIEDYEEALEHGDQIEEMQASLSDPGFEYTPDDGVLNNLAWVLSTSPDDELRDGSRAVELATLACEVTDFKAPHIISTLASAYAEKGDFDKAIEWIEKGLAVNEARELTDRVTKAEKKRQRESLEKELEFYKDGKPWRENQAEEEAAEKKVEKEKAKKNEKEDGSGSDGSDADAEETDDDNGDSKDGDN